MAAPIRYDWEKIRADYESGVSMRELSRVHGVDKSAISRRSKREGWEHDLVAVVNRRAEEKVNGFVTRGDPQKRDEAVDAAAGRKAAVLVSHQAAWPELKSLALRAVHEEDFELAKLAKITSETQRIIQDGERRAWGLDRPDAAMQQNTSVEISWQK